MSMWEIGLVLLIALILLGPRQLTETARVVGRLYREVTRLASDLRSSIDLDSPSFSNNDHFTSPSSTEEPAHSKPEDMHLSVEPGEKSGPDFYAELLETSKESDFEPQSAVPEFFQGAEEDSEDGSSGHKEKDVKKE